jgi:hypothetical protein
MKACSYFDNYTCSHESRVGQDYSVRVDYPDSHIEVDNRLVWFLPLLEKAYGDEAFYVHLVREHNLVAKSYMERWALNESIVKAFAHGIRMQPTIKKGDRYKACLEYVEYCDWLISDFCADKSNVIQINIDELHAEFEHFAAFIGVKGNIELAKKVCEKTSNINRTNILRRMISKLSQ